MQSTTFDSTDAQCIDKAQAAFANPEVGQQVAYISANFGVIAAKITELETQGLTINECSLILRDVKEAIYNATGELAEVFRKKFEDVLAKNPDFAKICQIGQILSGEPINDFDISPNLIPLFKYAPLTSCDVERSFSVYKSVLRDNRCSLTPEHIEMYLVINCNRE